MRRVTYYINDHEYMKKDWADKVDDIESILSGLPAPFACIYTLSGDEDSAFFDHYELKDVLGNKMDINSLNGYQRGVILCNAQRHYAGCDTDMFGIMCFKEEII